MISPSSSTLKQMELLQHFATFMTNGNTLQTAFHTDDEHFFFFQMSAIPLAASEQKFSARKFKTSLPKVDDVAENKINKVCSGATRGGGCCC